MGLVRLFLAAVVAIDHFNAILLRTMDPHAGDVLNYMKLGLDAGHAVMFFYVISGFLISYALENKYGTRTFEFYKSRFIRIFPLYWALYLGMVVFDLKSARTQIFNSTLLEWLPGLALLGSDWALSFIHYPAIFWNEYPALLTPAWSLGAELTFYILAPFLLLRSPKVCLAAFVGSAAIRGALVAQFGFSEIWTYHFFPATLVFFLLGHYARAVYRRVGHRLGRLNYLWLAAFIFLICHNVKTARPFDGPFFYMEMACFTLALPFLFQQTKDSRFLNSLGDLSYPLYLSQLLTLAIFTWLAVSAGMISATGEANFLSVLPTEPRFIAYTCFFLIACIAVSAVLNHCIEAPLAALCRRLFRPLKWRKAPVPTASLKLASYCLRWPSHRPSRAMPALFDSPTVSDAPGVADNSHKAN